MSRLIRFERTGGPEVLQWVEAEVPPPLAGEVRIRHEAVGVNFIDTYHRSGLYPVPLPSGQASVRVLVASPLSISRTSSKSTSCPVALTP